MIGKSSVLQIVLLLGLISHAVAGSAQSIIQRGGLRGGVVFMPRVSDPELAINLARQDRFLVYAQAEDAETVRVLREDAAGKGLLARTFYAGVGAIDHLPLAEDMAALVVVTDLSDADLTDANREAWVRALAPRRGVALLGNTTGKGLDQGKLKAWLADQPGLNVQSGQDGTWASFKREARKGADQWPQKFHDATNTRGSRDETFKPPFLPAWYGLPMHLGYWGDTMVTGNGRQYLVWANRAFLTPVSLLCRDIHSGVTLWERPFSWEEPRGGNRSGYWSGRSCMFADGDLLYLVLEDRLERLEGETGESIGSIAGPKPGGQIKWIGVEDGLLAVLAGEQDLYKTSSLQQRCLNQHGRELAVYDLRSDAVLWRATEDGDVDERDLAIMDGQIFYHVLRTRIVCRDLKTGKQIWENRDATVLEMLADRVEDTSALLVSARGLAAQPRALYFSAAWVQNRVALDPKTGSLLWHEPVGKAGRAVRDVVHDDKLYTSTAVRDLATGETIRESRVPADGCGPSFTAPGLVVTAFGGVHGIDDGTAHRSADLKPACDLGLVVSDGVGMSPAGVCRCALEMQGFRAFCGAGGVDASTPEPQAVRRMTGPALKAPLGAVATDRDWPTCRGSNRRSGSTVVKSPATAPTLRWQWQPSVTNLVPYPNTGYGATYTRDSEHLPTQAISVSGVAYFVDAQGVVRAVSLSDGTERWHYSLGSKCFTPPAYHRGRVVVGAADGWVTCLSAVDGQLAWRYRVAPVDRRIMWFGHLVSTWPLCGGVIVEDGVVYAVAGYQSGYGVHAVALTIADGSVLWEQDRAGGEAPNDSIGSMGGTTVASGRLWFCSGGTVPGSLDLKTGEPLVISDVRFSGSVRRGCAIGAVGDEWVMYGGRRLFATIDRWMHGERGSGFTLGRTDMALAEGKQVWLGTDVVAESIFMPVYDDELLVACSEYPPRNGKPSLQAWKTKDLLARAPVEGDYQRPFLSKRAAYRFGSLIPAKDQQLPDGGLWADVHTPVFDAVLAANALLVVHPKGEKNEQKAWQLSALSRADASTFWTIDLPLRPAWDGLSVAADGSVLLALWDGRVACYAEGTVATR